MIEVQIRWAISPKLDAGKCRGKKGLLPQCITGTLSEQELRASIQCACAQTKLFLHVTRAPLPPQHLQVLLTVCCTTKRWGDMCAAVAAR